MALAQDGMPMNFSIFNPDLHTGPLPSPCISICQIDAAGLCLGCLRTLDEIAVWGDASETERRLIWRAIIDRQASVG